MRWKNLYRALDGVVWGVEKGMFGRVKAWRWYVENLVLDYPKGGDGCAERVGSVGCFEEWRDACGRGRCRVRDGDSGGKS